MELKCPNCGTPAVAGEGGKVVCTGCGGTFRFRAGEAKLEAVAEFDQLKKKVAEQDDEIRRLREQISGGSSNGDEPDGQADDDDDDEEDDDDEDF